MVEQISKTIGNNEDPAARGALGDEALAAGDEALAAGDEDLAARAALGDGAAFRTLLGRHYDRVFRIVYSVVRNQSEAEDVTQEIWAGLPKKLRNWRAEAKLTSWLYRVALNAAKDSLRLRYAQSSGSRLRRNRSFIASREP